MSATGLERATFARGAPAHRANLTHALRDVIVGPLSGLILAFMVWRVLHGQAPAFDFRFAYSAAGQRVLHGQSPYLWSAAQFRDGRAFVYPALSALMFAPLSLIPQGAAAVLFTLVCVALVPATLWVLGVRDWRIYGVAFLWMPVYSGWMTANESLFLMFGLACLWRQRDRPLLAGLLVAAMISLKPLMWPLALWLLVTRRWRASAYTLIFGLALNLAAWWAIGFDQISRYLHAAGVDTSDSWRTGFGVPAFLGHFGAGQGTGVAVMTIISVLLVGAVAYCGYVKRNQRQALTLVVALALVSSPLLWGHYVVFLIVPLVLLRPRLHWVWALPVLMWVTQPAAPVHTWQEISIWSVAAVMFVALARGRLEDMPVEAAT